MKKIFTIVLVLSVFGSFGQRSGFHYENLIPVPAIGMEKTNGLDTLLPGNWETATDATTYIWSDEGVSLGYIFGTNDYGDLAYGQRFDVTEPYEIVRAIFWIGARLGTTGNVIFTIWDFSGSAPGDVIASVTVPFIDVTDSEDFEGAFVVEFDAPVLVSGNYLIGVDLSEMDDFVLDAYGLGNVSSTEDNGTELGYAYVLEGTQWVPVLNYDVDVDIAIFPIVQYPDPVETFSVTFNVDMGGATGFDPEVHEVWLTGNFTGWTEPGQEGSVQLSPVPPTKSEEPILFEIFDTFPPADWTLESTSPTTWARYGPLSIGETNVDPVEGEFFAMCSWSDSENQDEKLISKSIDLSAEESAELSFSFFGSYHWSVINDNCDLFVKVSIDGGATWTEIFSETDHPEFIEGYSPYTWLDVVLDLDEFVGNQDVQIMFQYVGFDGAQFGIDVIKVVGAAATAEELIYTATVEIEGGEIQYKYFSDAFGEGWDGGEWAGDPNRIAMIEADTVLNDIWNDPTVSVDEILLDMVTRVYPNPVRNTLFIKSEMQIDQLRMFDLAGRVVYQSQVMDFETTIDANPLRGGLYILQMVSGQQVKTHKIHVVK
jgi:hypothetical protein